MPWIQKNLMLVLGGLIGFILLVGSGFYFYSGLSHEGLVDTQLQDKRKEWSDLNNLNPFPDEKNIKATKDEAARVEKLAKALRESIHPVDVPSVTDTYGLRLLIETTISSLTKEAEGAGVNLPDRYAFTFQRLRDLPGQFNSNGIPKITEQVSHITVLCRILFNAKVHSLDTIRRSPVLKEENGSDYLTHQPLTNQWVIRTPYDFSFRSFSGELAEVMRGIAALPECIVVKTVNVEPTTLPNSSAPSSQPMVAGPSSSGPTYPGAPSQMDAAMRMRYGLGAMQGRSEGSGDAGGMSPELRARYGLGAPGGGGGDAAMRSRYGMGPGAATAPPPSLSTPYTPPAAGTTAPRGPAIVLDEKPLRVILQVDFVRAVNPNEGAKRAARPPPAPGGAPDTSTAAPAPEPPATE